MKKIFLIELLVANSFFGQAQDDFDYQSDFEAIVENSLDSSSNVFYPALLERFERNDSTLTSPEVLAMMIGFTESKNYKPYRNADRERQILDLIGSKNYQEALDSCNALLLTNPLNYAALMEKGFALWKLNDENFEFHKSKYFKVLDAVQYSGDGSSENAFFVLSPIDGQTIIRYVWQGSIGTMGSGSDSNGNFLDILEMEKEGQETMTIYFNIQHAVDNSEMMRQIEDATKKMNNK